MSADSWPLTGPVANETTNPRDTDAENATDALRGEYWVPVPGASIYEVSNTGRIRSIDRTVTAGGRGGTVFIRGIERRLLVDGDGYLRVGLRYDGDSKKQRTVRVHRIVCEAFHGPRPSPKHEVRHVNGIKTDNRPENLAWGTRVENMRDLVSHGMHNMARKTHCAHGHEFTAENTVYRRNQRCCRTCDRARCARYYHAYGAEQRRMRTAAAKAGLRYCTKCGGAFPDEHRCGRTQR